MYLSSQQNLGFDIKTLNVFSCNIPFFFLINITISFHSVQLDVSECVLTAHIMGSSMEISSAMDVRPVDKRGGGE